jgi:anti-sigma regulatory factor (Ser/Thr protein kinase)
VKSLTVPARINQLDAVLEFIDLELEAHGCPPKARMQLAVAAEEVFVNIARYAYAPGVGEATIEIGVAGEPPAAALRFLDRGVPYNPLQKSDPDVTLPAEDREIGGLGIFMVKKIVDRVQYAYEENRNVLTLTKVLA